MRNQEEKPKIQKPFQPHLHLGDQANKNIVEGELASGVQLEKLEVGKKLRVVTGGRAYTIEKRVGGVYMKGHPKYCPNFTKVNIHGSTWGGPMLKTGFIGRGMFL
ncbi:MAG: hypothetical protein HY506_01590 [Candidatus Yanofskybacteria bacterium]|nr:hypothetical protein [Candidatus Yanofskybacteria bacterium]